MQKIGGSMAHLMERYREIVEERKNLGLDLDLDRDYIYIYIKIYVKVLTYINIYVNALNNTIYTYIKTPQYI